MDLLALVVQVGMALAVALSAVTVWAFDRPGDAWPTGLRSRLLLGVPWGTLVVVAGVLAVYLFVQDARNGWYSPVVLPFISWSYLYPIGWLVAPFAHSGASHLTGNLLATVVLAPLAEYAWGHFPTDRGASTFSSWRTNPYVRAFVCFPLGVVAVGLATSLLQWGPMIGFSGVVFAFAGFALVRYPLATVVALVARELVSVAYYAIQDPVSSVEAGPAFSTPSWAGIAVQGHLLGLLLGVVVGFAVQRSRRKHPSALRLWLGTVLAGTNFSLWALWWYRGADTYVLHRGLGVVLVVALGVLVAAAVRSLDDDPVLRLPTRRTARGVRLRTVAAVLLVVPLVVMAPVAVAVNFSTVSDAPTPGESVTVNDYTVTYAEDVHNPKAAVLDVSVFGETADFTTGGVIVVSETREIWTREVSPGQLAFDGYRVVRLGGVGWHDSVAVQRRGWTAAGGGTVYQIWLRDSDGPWKHVYASANATARPVLAGKNVTVVPRNGSFHLAVSRGNETLATTPIPEGNETVTAGGIAFVRAGTQVIARVDGTRVPIATKETYR